MHRSLIANKLLELGARGCHGSVLDFTYWLQDESVQAEPAEVTTALEYLEKSGEFAASGWSDHPEYAPRISGPFPMQVAYTVPALIKSSPLQMVRSRVDAFLKYHNADEDKKTDVILGLTEALENAVKYGKSESRIHVQYSCDQGIFHAQITNEVRDLSPQKDIEAGKYREGGLTLMRGILVMQKLFDQMDLQIDEEKNQAVFSAQKKIH